MDIGSKIKEARLTANFTQEQTAEALGVSRQTVSNWETGKTYPDIISVIKMSDLYAVSLDRLLKEENPMTNYLTYLEESTNVVKSKEKLSKILLILTYLLIWGLSLIFFWFFLPGSDAGAYSLLVLWILLPVTTLVISVIISKNNYFGKLKWYSPFLFGIMYMLAEYGTFSMANTVSFGNINVPDFSMIIIGAAFSFAGLVIGAGIRNIKNRIKRNNLSVSSEDL